MARLTKYQKAKKKWFYKNVIEFCVQFYDANTNNAIVQYHIEDGLELRWYNAYCTSLKRCLFEIRDLEPWQVYFKLRRHRRNNHLRVTHVLVFDECRRTK